MTKIIDINDLDIATVEDELLSAILICLFTDAEAEAGEIPQYAQGQQGGWWGDDIETVIKGRQTKFSWGSKFWMLKRAKVTTEETGIAEQLLAECLSPLVEAGFIKEDSISLELKDNRLTLVVPLESETYQLEGLDQWLGR